MKIDLPKSIEKIIVREVKKNITSLNVKKVIDFPENKEVRVFLKELDNHVVLWSGEQYDMIGQWTDSDVEERLIELFS
jgi:hypothetical protein